MHIFARQRGTNSHLGVSNSQEKEHCGLYLSKQGDAKFKKVLALQPKVEVGLKSEILAWRRGETTRDTKRRQGPFKLHGSCHYKLKIKPSKSKESLVNLGAIQHAR